MNSLGNLDSFYDNPTNMYGIDIEALEAMPMTEAENINEESSINGMKLIIEFPMKSEDDKKIKREVNSILRNALMEQMKHRTS